MTSYGRIARESLEGAKGAIIAAMNNAAAEDPACLFNLLEDIDALLELRRDLVLELSKTYSQYAGPARQRAIAEKIAEGTF